MGIRLDEPRIRLMCANGGTAFQKSAASNRFMTGPASAIQIFTFGAPASRTIKGPRQLIPIRFTRTPKAVAAMTCAASCSMSATAPATTSRTTVRVISGGGFISAFNG